MTTQEFEFGLDSPVYVSVDAFGQPLSGDVVIRNTIEEAVHGDAVGIDSFNISEHYRPDFMDSAGHVILAAIAGRTERISPSSPRGTARTTANGVLQLSYSAARNSTTRTNAKPKINGSAPSLRCC